MQHRTHRRQLKSNIFISRQNFTDKMDEWMRYSGIILFKCYKNKFYLNMKTYILPMLDHREGAKYLRCSCKSKTLNQLTYTHAHTLPGQKAKR